MKIDSLHHGVSFHPSVSSCIALKREKVTNMSINLHLLLIVSHKTAACTRDIISNVHYGMYFITS